jgi:hypothetical protein
MTPRQQEIARLTEKEEKLIDRFNDCEDEEECCRLLQEIAQVQFVLHCLDTAFVDA